MTSNVLKICDVNCKFCLSVNMPAFLGSKTSPIKSEQRGLRGSLTEGGSSLPSLSVPSGVEAGRLMRARSHLSEMDKCRPPEWRSLHHPSRAPAPWAGEGGGRRLCWRGSSRRDGPHLGGAGWSSELGCGWALALGVVMVMGRSRARHSALGTRQRWQIHKAQGHSITLAGSEEVWVCGEGKGGDR